MVGYQLKNTVTENGSVARGVCTTDADSNLVSVVEHTQIEQYENGIRFTEDKGETWHDIDGDTTVSMNLWGFSESFIKEANRKSLHTEKNIYCQFSLSFMKKMTWQIQMQD